MVYLFDIFTTLGVPIQDLAKKIRSLPSEEDRHKLILTVAERSKKIGRKAMALYHPDSGTADVTEFRRVVNALTNLEVMLKRYEENYQMRLSNRVAKERVTIT